MGAMMPMVKVVEESQWGCLGGAADQGGSGTIWSEVVDPLMGASGKVVALGKNEAWSYASKSSVELNSETHE